MNEPTSLSLSFSVTCLLLLHGVYENQIRQQLLVCKVAVLPESGSSLHFRPPFSCLHPFSECIGRGYGLLWVVSLDTSGMNPLNSHDETDIVICLPTLPQEGLLLCSSGSISSLLKCMTELRSYHSLAYTCQWSTIITHLSLALAMEALCGLTPAFLCVLLPQRFLLISLLVAALALF